METVSNPSKNNVSNLHEELQSCPIQVPRPSATQPFHPSQYPTMRWQSKVPILSVDLDSFSLNAVSYLYNNGTDPKQ